MESLGVERARKATQEDVPNLSQMVSAAFLDDQ